jgi:hypothetical protein
MTAAEFQDLMAHMARVFLARPARTRTCDVCGYTGPEVDLFEGPVDRATGYHDDICLCPTCEVPR